MRYFAQLTSVEQLMILERLVTILKKDMNSYTSVYEAVENAINSKLDDLEDTVEIRVCDECGKIMVEGYCIDGGMEYYCSDACLHKNYTKEQWLAIYAGLDDNKLSVPVKKSTSSTGIAEWRSQSMIFENMVPARKSTKSTSF